MQYFLVAPQPVHVVKRGVASEHLEHDAAEAPPVSRKTVAAVLNDFRAHVKRAAHAGVGARFLLHGQHDAAVEITHADEAALIEQDVAGLQVAVHYTDGVHELEGNYELRGPGAEVNEIAGKCGAKRAGCANLGGDLAGVTDAEFAKL